jgi:hypothetical protein
MRFVTVVACLATAGAIGWADPGPFTVTFRLGTQVIGPEPAIALVLPVGAAGASGSNAPDAPREGPPRSEVWVTLAPSVAADRLASLASETARGRTVRGTCEIVATPRGGPIRRYTVAGCFAKRIEVTGTTRRIALGYRSIVESRG